MFLGFIRRSEKQNYGLEVTVGDLIVRISDELHEKIKDYARAKKTTIKQVVTRMLEKMVKK